MKVQVLYRIYLAQGWSCACFSDGDLFTNIEFAIRENKRIIGVERLIQ